MKTKLEMAHEWYMMQTRRNGCALVADAWQYADAMQAAAEKRSVYGVNWDKEKGGQKTFVNDAEQDHTWAGEEWQPDWSQAPTGYDWFVVGGRSGKGFFCLVEPSIVKDHYWFVGEDSISIDKHDYKGDWRDSLRKRHN